MERVHAKRAEWDYEGNFLAQHPFVAQYKTHYESQILILNGWEGYDLNMIIAIQAYRIHSESGR